MIKVIIVDDESRAIDTLANLLSGNPDIAILKKITDPENVVATVRELHSALTRFKETVLNRDLTKKYQSLLSTIPPHGKIKFATGSGFFLLNPEDIIYILADWNYSEVFLSDEKKELITTNLGTLQKFLPCSTFYRIDRSTIINLAYLTRVNRKKRMILLIKDGKEFSFNVPLLNIRKMERLFVGNEKY